MSPSVDPDERPFSLPQSASLSAAKLARVVRELGLEAQAAVGLLADQHIQSAHADVVGAHSAHARWVTCLLIASSTKMRPKGANRLPVPDLIGAVVG